MHYCNKEEKEILSELNTSKEGLSTAAANKKLETDGKNIIKDESKISSFKIFISQFKNLLIILLIIAGVISLFFNQISDCLVIFSIVLINALVGFFQEHNAAKAIRALKNMLSSKTRVIRDGVTQEIAAENLVVGDIIILEEGQKVPADARLIETMNLDVNESTLTGESWAVSKTSSKLKKEINKITEMTNMVFTGTNVIKGKGLAIVTATGMNTEFGKIATMTMSTEEKLSPLQKEIDSVGTSIAKAMVVICVFVFLYGIFIRGDSLATMFFYSISLAVAIVPEGLPSTITISLAMGVRKMADKKAIMRKLSAVETLGCITVICCDKTGTITKNRMSVEKIYVNNKYIDANSLKLDSKENQQILRISALCNNVISQDGKFIGDPLETALADMIDEGTKTIQAHSTAHKRLSEIPFDSDRKLMTVINFVGKNKIAHVKGSPEKIIQKSSYIYINGKIKKLTIADKKKLLEKNAEMGEAALRVLGFAFKDCSKLKNIKDESKIEKDLIFVGFIGMSDQIRDGVNESIAACKESGIKTIMISGDQKVTAFSIAKKIGLVSDINEIITGTELEKMTDDELAKATLRIKVFAGSTPKDKMRIISALRRNHEIIAMTGDGVNDAPALKNADIGIAMGISGTDVSKEASNMILLDDAFPTIVSAIREGRAIYENIKKFVLFVLTGIATELFCVLTGLFLGSPLPILAVQILWIDLCSEVLPALTFAYDKTEEDLLKRKPRNMKDNIIGKEMITNILRLSIWATIVTMLTFFYVLKTSDVVRAQTVTFTIIVLFQMFNIFNMKNMKRTIFRINSLKNIYTLAAIFITIVLQILIVQTPIGNELLHTTPLLIKEWIMIFVLASSIIWFEEIRKIIANGIEKMKKNKN